tara:strand:- start:1961 stop:2158 length:198 start_codon:yes stop_codon:yes gene_type:complete
MATQIADDLDATDTLCGHKIGMSFCFTSIDHWFHNRICEGRLIGCPECLEKITETMNEEKSLHEE